MRYASMTLSELLSCPFCRELYSAAEAKACPTCGLPLAPMSKLPPSHEATLEEDWPREPEWEPLPLLYWRRGRGALVLFAAVGVACFFMPWVNVTVPEITSFSGVDIARVLGWVWGCPVAWLSLVPTVLSRRSVAKMRGARVIASLLSAVPLVTTVVLLLTPPGGGAVPVRFTYDYGFYATLLVSALALPFAIRLGGRLDDLPMPRGMSKPDSLH
ncbi:MAG: hypothetical protein MUF54_04230 [Polyangiaceae bacterium]|jgi:hypothetical protein|nr:hypothetical protein [Polyangiaceae bacterium]